MKILLLDNHDSFTYNLAEALRKLRKNNVNIETAESLVFDEIENYDKIIFSPGPGLPEEHPAMFEILERYGETKSILGVCLGMQAIALFYGGTLYHLPDIVHGQGKKLRILNKDFYLYRDIADMTEVGLYHSWAVSQSGFPGCLEINALSGNGLILSFHHKKYDICGVQFHPESIITKDGLLMLNNWLNH